MKRSSIIAFLATSIAVLVTSFPAAAQQAAASLQEQAAAAKQSAAQNQQALRSYTWIEKTEISVKGEVKNSKLESCRYAPDGKVQKTQISEPPPPADKKPGLRGKAIEKKTGEMKAEMEQAAALVHGYVPPDPALMQIAVSGGKVSLAQQGPGLLALKFADYRKPGDALVLTFDAAVKALRQIDVTSYLEKPSDLVTLQVKMSTLADASYPASVTLAIPASKIEVRITNSNYQKLAQ